MNANKPIQPYALKELPYLFIVKQALDSNIPCHRLWQYIDDDLITDSAELERTIIKNRILKIYIDERKKRTVSSR